MQLNVSEKNIISAHDDLFPHGVLGKLTSLPDDVVTLVRYPDFEEVIVDLAETTKENN